MTDRRGVLLVLVLVFGLSLAGGYSFAAFSDEERVGITIDAAGLDRNDDVGAADQSTLTESATPTPEATDSETQTGTGTADTAPTPTTDTSTDSPTPTLTDSPTPTLTDSPTPMPGSPGGGEQATEPG